jgi:ATP adenylyltransferase
MDHLWTPWRYDYITGAKTGGRKGVPTGLEAWPGPLPRDSGSDRDCVFCNLIQSVEWGITQEKGIAESAERAGHIIARLRYSFICLNAFPYASGHLLIVPYRHTDSLAKLNPEESTEMMVLIQKSERVLREVYRPDGINVGVNLGQAAGAGVADHLHVHMLPRWLGDANFMTTTAETRVLPETLNRTWERTRRAFLELD